jgi:uncharacterized protein YggU (UPF0235/DUF167 family)
VIDLLADKLGIAASAIEIVSGHTAPDKVVVVPLSADVVAGKLDWPTLLARKDGCD